MLSAIKFNLLWIFSTFPAGVDLFMVLSGFCLFLPLCKSASSLDKWNVKNYFFRRARRIIPPYYAAIAYAVLQPVVLVVLFRTLGLEAKWQQIPSLWQFVSHAFFIHTLFPSTWDGINGSFWSLGLEGQFYVAFPIIIFALRRYGIHVLWAVLGLSIVYRIIVALLLPPAWGWPVSFLFSIFFLGRWMQFALGMASAWIVAQHWRSARWQNSGSGTLVIVAAAGLYILAVSELFIGVEKLFPLRDLLLAVSFAMLLTSLCITRTPLNAIFGNKIVAGLGFISYSVFLIHQPTAYYASMLLKRRLHMVDGVLLFVLLCTVIFAAILSLAYVFFLAFERPFLSPVKPKGPVAAKPLLSAMDGVTAAVQDQAVP